MIFVFLKVGVPERDDATFVGAFLRESSYSLYNVGLKLGMGLSGLSWPSAPQQANKGNQTDQLHVIKNYTRLPYYFFLSLRLLLHLQDCQYYHTHNFQNNLHNFIIYVTISSMLSFS